MNSDITSGTERGHLESESLAKKLAHLTGITRACFLPEDYMTCPKNAVNWKGRRDSNSKMNKTEYKYSVEIRNTGYK